MARTRQIEMLAVLAATLALSAAILGGATLTGGGGSAGALEFRDVAVSDRGVDNIAGHSLTAQSEQVSVSKGAGPGGSQPKDCTGAEWDPSGCGRNPTPSVGTTPAWFNVTSSTGEITPTYAAAVAWDPNWDDGVLVYFGGCQIRGACPTNDTWVYDGDVWQNVTASLSTSPPPLEGESMDWDPAWDGILLVGGETPDGQSDAGSWLFTNGTWENITGPTGGPEVSPASVFGAMAWDSAIPAMVYLGGCTNSTCAGVLNTTWILTGTHTWSSSLGIGAQYGQSMAYDPANGELVTYGGTSPTGAQLNTTWAFLEGRGWENLTASTVGCLLSCDLYPVGRSFASMTWDPQTGSILLFGGVNTSDHLFSDPWSFAGSNWVPFPLNGSFAPPAGAFQSMPASSVGFAPILVGGECSCAGQTYTLDVPPDPVISLVSPTPADVGADVAVTVQGTAGTGSGPWISLDASFGASQFNSTPIYGVNASSAWSFTENLLTYPAAGTYPVVVSVADYFYVRASAYYNLTVVVGPHATVSATPNPGEAGHIVQFSSTVSGGVTPYAYYWEFGGAGAATGNAPEFVFPTAGTYDVRLNLTDAGGQSAAANLTVNILPGVEANALSNVTATDIGVAVSFTGSASSGIGPYSSYEWSFGDGSTASGAITEHSYAVQGVFHATLNVTDSLGFVGTISLPLRVNPLPAAGSIDENPSPPVAGSGVVLAVGITGGTAPYTYAWTFGNGQSSALATPYVLFGSVGTYFVQVTVTDAVGQTVTAHTIETVTGSSPIAGLSPFSGAGLYLWLAALLAAVAVVGMIYLRRRVRRANAPPKPSLQEPPGFRPLHPERAPDCSGYGHLRCGPSGASRGFAGRVCRLRGVGGAKRRFGLEYGPRKGLRDNPAPEAYMSCSGFPRYGLCGEGAPGWNGLITGPEGNFSSG